MTVRKINTRSITFFISPELYERICKFKQDAGMSHSEMIRRAINQFLEGKVSE